MNREETAKALDALGVTVTYANDPVDGSRIEVVSLDDLTGIGYLLVQGESTDDLCEWCDMPARGIAWHQGHDTPRRSCGEKYHGEYFEPDAEPRVEPTDAMVTAAMESYGYRNGLLDDVAVRAQMRAALRAAFNETGENHD